MAVDPSPNTGTYYYLVTDLQDGDLVCVCVCVCSGVCVCVVVVVCKSKDKERCVRCEGA